MGAPLPAHTGGKVEEKGQIRSVVFRAFFPTTVSPAMHLRYLFGVGVQSSHPANGPNILVTIGLEISATVSTVKTVERGIKHLQ